MKIAFTYNVKHNIAYSTDANQDDIEFDSIDVIEGIENAIKSLGHEVIKIEADNDAYDKLKASTLPGGQKIDLVFNIAEGLKGDARESQIPIFCEMLGIPYTHSSPTTHAIKLSKHITKIVLMAEGINCPKSVVATKQNVEKITSEELIKGLQYPLIVKPNLQGSSKGIFNDSVVNNKEELVKMVSKVLKEFDTEALIEEFIDGREFTVPLLGNPPKVLPIVEQRFDFMPEGFNKVAGYELKWLYEDKLPNPFDSVYCPAPLDDDLKKEIEEVSQKVWKILNVKDCARIDYRLRTDPKNPQDRPDPKKDLYFIEINTLPGINPDEKMVSYFPYSARIAGLSFKDLVGKIIESAINRYK